jgi:hypothetical protein
LYPQSTPLYLLLKEASASSLLVGDRTEVLIQGLTILTIEQFLLSTGQRLVVIDRQTSDPQPSRISSLKVLRSEGPALDQLLTRRHRSPTRFDRGEGLGVLALRLFLLDRPLRIDRSVDPCDVRLDAGAGSEVAAVRCLSGSTIVGLLVEQAIALLGGGEGLVVRVVLAVHDYYSFRHVTVVVIQAIEPRRREFY